MEYVGHCVNNIMGKDTLPAVPEIYVLKVVREGDL
jgi:hypothetical protein